MYHAPCCQALLNREGEDGGKFSSSSAHPTTTLEKSHCWFLYSEIPHKVSVFKEGEERGDFSAILTYKFVIYSPHSHLI